nr:hypothetical protein [Tanacetum cinerariifolium]
MPKSESEQCQYLPIVSMRDELLQKKHRGSYAYFVESGNCLLSSSTKWVIESGALDQLTVIMECLVKISKKACILKLKQRHLMILTLHPICRIHQGRYDVSVPALHKRPRWSKDQYAVSRRSLYAAFNLKLANVPCDLNEEDDSKQQMTHGSGDDMEYDPSNARGDDEVELTHKESLDSDDEDEVAEIFRIETNVFDFETRMCRAFKEFNYLLQIDPDVLTKNIKGFKTYKIYKDDWMYEWNKDVPWVHERPWTNNGAWEEPTPVEHYCEPFLFKSRHKEWPTRSWKDDGYCNGGNQHGAYIVGNTLRYHDLEWYEALEDSKLIDEALKNKAIMEGIIDEDDETHHEEHGNNERCELFDEERPICNIRRFKMIKYSFRDDEEYVVVKEDEYDDFTMFSSLTFMEEHSRYKSGTVAGGGGRLAADGGGGGLDGSGGCWMVLDQTSWIIYGLYMAVEETLKAFGQWLCRKCMDLHVVSRVCHHPDGLVRFSKGPDDMSGYIVGISKLSNKEPGIEVVSQSDYVDAWGQVVTFFKMHAAVKVLSSSGVALYCDYTIKALEAKYPYKLIPSMPSITFSKPLIIAEIDSVFGCIKLFPKGKEMSKYLSDFQFGVRVSVGVEAVLHNVNRVLSEYHNVGSLAMLDVDLSNPFNLVDRSTLLHEIKDSCKLLLHAWYLDDGTVIGDSEEVASVLGIIKVVAQPDYVDAWVRSLATWGKDDGMIMLVKSILDGFALGSIGYGGVKVLSSSGVALYCDYTIKALEAKHPYKSPPSMPSITFSKPPVIAEIDSVFGCIKSFPKEFVAFAPLTPLLKLYNKIRPIAVGIIWRRFCFQGFHERCRVLSEYHNVGSLAMLTVDLSNAFNLVDRSTLLHEVRQGDLLGPLVFALILHSLLHKIKKSCKLLLHAWYLDDGTVIGDSKEFASVLGIIKPSSSVKLLEGAVSRDVDFEESRKCC